MTLTELTLNGFKSFAQKTTLRFDSGVTGIVGPNGSGKSNITEAIRWVMGEMSVKSLRSSKMTDVIFSGSKFRPPMNQAEVTLVFNNEDHRLASSSERVTVTRRLLHSGDSQYLINQKDVRLKDVRRLFIDSGLTEHSLAIISQGKVDEILNSNPQERRGLFEEAAGVLRFKLQKQQAVTQLEATQANLVRINDLVRSLKERLDPLAEQQSLAKQYQFEKGQFDRQEKTLLAFEIQDLAEKQEQVESKSKQNQQLLDRFDHEVNQSQQELSQKRDQLTALTSRKDDLQKRLLQCTQEEADLKTQLEVGEQSHQYQTATKKEYTQQYHQLEAEQSQTLQKKQTLQKRLDQISEKLVLLRKQKKAQQTALNHDPKKLDQQVEQTRSQYIQLLQDQTTANNEATYLMTQLKRNHLDKIHDPDQTRDQFEKSQVKLEQLENKKKQLRTQLVLKKEQFDQLSKSLSERSRSRQQDQLLLERQQTQLERLKAQKETLLQLQKRHEGYYSGVRHVLNHLPMYEGIIGAVGDLIRFPKRLEAALTTALGAGVQDLVARDQSSARDAIQQLKQMRGGRATFLPLDHLRYGTIPASTLALFQSFPGYEGVASDLVETKGKVDLTAAIHYLLGNVIIVDTMDTALAISRKSYRHYRTVTLDGDVLNPGGAMTGGVRNVNSNSPLALNGEIIALIDHVGSLMTKIKTQREQVKKITLSLAPIQSQQNQLQEQIQELIAQLNTVSVEINTQQHEVDRLSKESDLRRAQEKEREKTRHDLQNQLAATRQKQEDLVNQLQQCKTKLERVQEQLKASTQDSQSRQKELSELSAQEAVANNQHENLEGQLQQEVQQLDTIKAQLVTIADKIKQLDQKHLSSSSLKEQIQKQQSQLEVTKKNLQDELKTHNERAGQLNVKIERLTAIASRNYELRKTAAQSQETIAVSLADLKSQIDQRLTKLRQRYSLSFEAALQQASKLENTKATRLRLQKKIRLHEMALKDLGDVNLQAISEYAEVKDRYDFLSKQQNDLLQAKNDLQTTMANLDSEVKRRFSTTFKQIADQFSLVFPQVFGGGQAKLVLTDPDDLLTTGVELIAQPPGKKLQKLSLLSGGERALTAITLLFAMLTVDPVPFCVLDEVEAALDDENVDRFAHFLKHFGQKTQFIVITHRRGTMLQADQLLGVVMQESGVSQVVSVTLKQLAEKVEDRNDVI